MKNKTKETKLEESAPAGSGGKQDVVLSEIAAVLSEEAFRGMWAHVEVVSNRLALVVDGSAVLRQRGVGKKTLARFAEGLKKLGFPVYYKA